MSVRYFEGKTSEGGNW